MYARSLERLGGDAWFEIPWVWGGSTDRVLVMEHVTAGKPQ
jgi:hypothetical protein